MWGFGFYFLYFIFIFIYFLGGGNRQGHEALVGREGEVALGHALELRLQMLPAVEGHVTLHRLRTERVVVYMRMWV